jgi:exopolysaccharide production protein ExoZ
LNIKVVRSFSESLDHAPTPAPAQDTQRYYQIQALRFFAAFAVVVGHAFIFTAQKFPLSADMVEFAGWAGGWAVTLFFCISGFVITHGAQGLGAGQFLVHRLARIYPAYWLAVVVVCAVKYALFHGLPTQELSLTSFTLLPAGERGYPLWIEWSLVYEVFFYTLFALLWIPRSNNVLLVFVTLWLLVIAAAALVRPDWASARYPTIGQILFSSRNLPFILGVYCYFLRPLSNPSIRAILLLLFPAGLMGIAAVPGTDLKILAGSIAAFGLLGYMASARSTLQRDAITVKLGDFSYGIYLIHISVITILLSIGFKQYQNPWLTIVAVTAAGTACGAVFGFVELAMYKRVRSFLDQRFATRIPPPLVQADVPG